MTYCAPNGWLLTAFLMLIYLGGLGTGMCIHYLIELAREAKP